VVVGDFIAKMDGIVAAALYAGVVQVGVVTLKVTLARTV